MDITEKIDKLLRGVDSGIHAFDRMVGQMKKDNPTIVKGSPSDEKKKIRDFEKARKEWEKEEKEKKYGYRKK